MGSPGAFTCPTLRVMLSYRSVFFIIQAQPLAGYPRAHNPGNHSSLLFGDRCPAGGTQPEFLHPYIHRHNYYNLHCLKNVNTEIHVDFRFHSHHQSHRLIHLDPDPHRFPHTQSNTNVHAFSDLYANIYTNPHLHFFRNSISIHTHRNSHPLDRSGSH